MHQPLQPLTVCFVSGKGGVGKTSLSVNIAWTLSQVMDTVLVDLDFLNQGATGLFGIRADGVTTGAQDIVLGDSRPEACEATSIAPRLAFVHARARENHAHRLLLTPRAHDDVEQRLGLLLTALRVKGFDAIVLDCHGGLDTTSLAARRLSDRTILVTEADIVTFHGSMELLRFYARGGESLKAAPNVSLPPIEVVVNRVPPKYVWSDLDRAYRRVLGSFGPAFQVSSSVLAYVPAEDSVAGDFGSYPFAIVVAPKSVFAEKVKFIAFSLVKNQLTAARALFPPFARLEHQRHYRKTETQLISREEQNRRSVLSAVAWFTSFWSVFALGFVALVAREYFSFLDLCSRMVECVTLPFNTVMQGALKSGFESIVESTALLYIAFAATLISLVVGLRALWRLTRYYGDRFRALATLSRVAPNTRTAGSRLQLLRLLVLQTGSVLGMSLLALTIFILVTIALAVWRTEPYVPSI